MAGDGLLLWNGVPYSGAAPLFLLLLAAVGSFGIDVVAAAGYVNAAAFGLTVFVVAAWLKRHVRSPLLAVWAGCACALSPTLAVAAAQARMEMVFILFIVVSLSLLDRFLSSGKAPALVLAAAAAGAALLARYSGWVLIGAGALVLLARTGVGFRLRVRDVALWSVVALVPVGVWFVRHFLIFGSFPGSGYMDGFSALLSLHRATGEFTLWLLGPAGLGLLNRALGSVTGIDPAAVAAPAIVVKAVLLAAPVIGAAYALARYRPGFLRHPRTILTVAMIFIACYSLFLAIYLPLSDFMLSVRLLWPLFPPLLVVATLTLDEFTANGHTRTGAAPTKIGKAGPAVLAIVLSLWLAQQAGAAWSTTRRWLNEGSPVYSSRAWVESDVIRHLNANRIAGAVWSSEPPALYFHTELRRISTIGRSLDGLVDRLALRERGDSVYLVLFKRSFLVRSYDYGLDDVGALPGLAMVAYLDDGVILRSVAAGGPVAPTTPSDPALQPAGAPPGSAGDARNQVVRAHFDVHVYGDALAYVKEPCTAEDVKARFFLHLVPTDAADLAAHRRQAGWENRDFFFAERGVILDGRCLAVVALPDYRISHLETGQYSSASGQLWNAAIDEQRLRLIPYRTAYRSVLAGDYGTAKVRSTFDLYLDAAERTLTYLREPCTADDVSDPFFLRVQPARPGDLLDRLSRLQSGFEHLDFSFTERGVLLDGACVATAALPDYEIARIRTGQYVPGEGNTWSAMYVP